MTEFSDNLDWFNTALFIHRSLTIANSSAYIYWKLAWSTPASGENAGMISVNSSGAYTVTPYYYLVKHFSKNVDVGYHRIDVTSTNAVLYATAFVSVDSKKITLIVINTGTSKDSIKPVVTGKTVTSISVVQSKENSYYKTVPVISVEDLISLPSKSITTIILEIP